MGIFLIYWLPVFVWMAFLFPVNDALSFKSTSSFLMPILTWLLPHASQSTITALHAFIRKCAHFGGYAILAFLLFRSFRATEKKTWKVKWVMYSGILAISYAILDEFLQTFISSRTGSIFDCLIDSAGVVFALMIVSRKKRLRD
jgi:VanZ family protein